MILEAETWIEYPEKPKLMEPVAVVGSSGLRSVGETAIDQLIKQLQPLLFAKLYSTHFPVFYHTKPSYAPQSERPGEGGVKLLEGEARRPNVEFYSFRNPDLIITKGYHANFDGQYEVVEKVLDLFAEHAVKKMVVLAGYAREGDEVCCAATNLGLIEEMKEYEIHVGYEGPFYGFSGLVFGLAKLRGIAGLCLFGRTVPNLEDPEYPDPEAAKAVLIKLGSVLKIRLSF